MRDWLLGRQPREFDYLFDEAIGVFLQGNPTARKVGRTTAVWLLDGCEYSPLKGATLSADLAARDVTINALAVDERSRLYAHPQALDDLRQRRLRPCSASSLLDEPGRVFRVARLACQFPDFELVPQTFDQMREAAANGSLHTLPAERVCREFMKALSTSRPSRWLDVLREGGCLSPWFAEFTEADSVPAGPAAFHTGSVVEHLLRVMDAVSGDPLAVWVAMCHDLGKICTNKALWPHHYGHEVQGVPLAEALGARLALPRRYRQAGSLACRLHMKAGNYHRLRPGTRRDLLVDVCKAHLADAFWRVVEADSGLDLASQVEADLALLRAVVLPEDLRNRGEASGKWLRDLQCQALSRRKPDVTKVLDRQNR